jgi:hypothetical protein
MNKYDSMSFDELRALMVERGILERKIEGEQNGNKRQS